MRLLVIEDNPMHAEVIAEFLREDGYAVDIASDGKEGEELALSIPYDGIILDVLLPKKSGYIVCRDIREANMDTPILMVSGKRKDDPDVIKGLNCGADDYLLKPFKQEILDARVRALVRKSLGVRNPILHIRNLILDTAHRQVWQGRKEVRLTLKEFAMLEYLAYHPNMTISRVELEQHVWDVSLDSNSNIIDAHIKNLRKKLGRNEDLIKTVIGLGYKLAVSKSRSLKSVRKFVKNNYCLSLMLLALFNGTVVPVALASSLPC